jgi:hypothetical protein
MYAHALKRRETLGLDESELLLTRATRRGHALNVAVGAVSILVVSFGGERWSGVAGLTYALIGPLMTVNGFRTGRALRRLEARRAAAAAPGPSPPGATAGQPPSP